MIFSKLKKIITILVFYNLIFISVLKSEIIKEIRINSTNKLYHPIKSRWTQSTNHHLKFPPLDLVVSVKNDSFLNRI